MVKPGDVEQSIIEFKRQFDFDYNEPIYRCFISPYKKPNLKFISEDEINKKTYKKINNTKTLEKINELLRQLKSMDTDVWREIDDCFRRHEIFIPIEEKNLRQDGMKDIFEFLRHIATAIVKKKEEYKCIEKIIDLLLKIKMPVSTLGCYVHGCKTIYLCLDRIYKEAYWHGLNFEKLAEVIYIHEYAHFVHISSMLSASRSEKGSAVKETIAAFVEQDYAYRDYGRGIGDWVKKKNEKGVFPVWKYAGANIIMNSNGICNVGMETWMENIVYLSLIDSNAAYDALMALYEEELK